MPGDSFVENNVPFERRWFRFSQGTWVVLGALLVASATGLSGGGGPLAKRATKANGLEVRWERLVRANSIAGLQFVVESPAGEAHLTLRDDLVTKSTLRDITPQPRKMIAGRDALTLVYDVAPGSAATIRITQALLAPGRLRSKVESQTSSIVLDQIVFP